MQRTWLKEIIDQMLFPDKVTITMDVIFEEDKTTFDFGNYKIVLYKDGTWKYIKE